MSYYQTTMMKSIVLTNDKLFLEEIELFDKKMSNNDKMTKTLKKELYGNIQISQMPFDLQEEFTRSKLNIPPHIWGGYDCELKGKTIAVEVVKSQIELLERFEGILERNKKKK